MNFDMRHLSPSVIKVQTEIKILEDFTTIGEGEKGEFL